MAVFAKDLTFLLIKHVWHDNLCSSLWDGVANPCSLVQDGEGFGLGFPRSDEKSVTFLPNPLN